MLHLLGPLPRECYVAVSGGRDSMALLHFMTAVPERMVHVLYFNHGTPHGKEAEKFVWDYCQSHALPYSIAGITREQAKGESKEMYWREQRYKFFDKCSSHPILMAHHLDDCVETWLWTALHGQPRCIPYRRGNVIRPFLLNARTKVNDYVEHHKISFIEDPSNIDQTYVRNFIRGTIIPNALSIHPGLHKEVRKVVMKEYALAEKESGYMFNE